MLFVLPNIEIKYLTDKTYCKTKVLFYFMLYIYDVPPFLASNSPHEITMPVSIVQFAINTPHLFNVESYSAPSQEKDCGNIIRMYVVAYMFRSGTNNKSFSING